MSAINSSIPLMLQPPSPNPGPLEQYARMLAIKNEVARNQAQQQALQTGQLQQEQEKINLQTAQQEQNDRQVFNKAFTDANGDWDTAIQKATKNGASGTFITKAQIARTDQVTKMATMHKELLANESAKHEAIGVSAQRVLDADPENQATVYAQERNSHLLSGAWKPSDIPEQMPSIDELKATAATSKAAVQMAKDALDLQEKRSKLPGEQAEATAKGYSTAAQTMQGVADQLGWTARRNLAIKNNPDIAPLIPEQFSPENAKAVQQLGIAPKELASMPLDKLEYQDFAKKNPGKGAFDFLAAKTGAEAAARSNADLAVLNALNKQSQASGRTIAPGLTPDATDSAATTFHNTGQLPPIGRGAAGQAQRTAIMNREREMFPGTVLSENSAEFKANQESLKGLQKQFDAVSAFENTANKNLDIFTNLAKKAIDSGIPLLNAPLRTGAALLGSSDQAALNAARQVAVNEIAKVTSNPGLSGQLSDSARHEIEAFNPANATFGQTMRVAQVLKQDMANRHQSYQEQIDAIHQRMGGKASPAAPTQSTGKTLSLAQVQKAAKDHGVSVDEATRQAKAAGYTVQ